MTYPALSRLIEQPGSTVGTNSSNGILLDTSGASQHIFLKSDGNASDSGIRSVDADTAAQIAEATIVDIYGSAAPNQIASPICLTPNGQIVSIGQAWFNGTAQISLLNRTTFSLIGSWNDTNAGGGIPSLPYAPGLPQSLGATAKQGISYVAAPITATLGGNVSVLQAGPSEIIYAGHNFDVDEDAALSCGSPATVGKLYTLGYSTSVDATPVGVYVTTIGSGAAGYDSSTYPTANSAITTVKTGTIAPTDIDLAWTNFSAITQPGFDKSDNTLLAFFQTTDAVANKSYLAKIDPATGTIVWKTAVADINERFQAMGASNIDGGVFAFLSTRILYVFDTATGAITSQTTLSVGGGISNRNSIYDYATNSVYFYGQWASAATPPYPVGGISPDGTEFWYRLQLGDEPSVVLASCCEDPVIVDPDVVALLSARALRVAYLVQFDFKTTPQYLWNGHYPLTWPLVGGHTWQGLRNLGGIEGLEEAADMTATQMKFTLSGVNAATLALAIGEDRDEYVGRLVTVWMQFFDSDWQPKGAPIARACGIMDGIEITRSRDGDKDKQNSVRVLTLTAESIFYGRGIAPAGNYTERDQKFRSEGDRGLDFVNEVQNTVVQIPW